MGDEKIARVILSDSDSPEAAVETRTGKASVDGNGFTTSPRFSALVSGSFTTECFHP